MQNEIVVLIIDPSEEDRSLVRSILEPKVGRFIEASDSLSAWEAVRGINRLTAMVANLDSASGVDVIDLRDHLHRELSYFPTAFCSHEDMTAFYSRVLEGERLFLKPINRRVLLEWFDEVLAKKSGSTSTEASSGAEPIPGTRPGGPVAAANGENGIGAARSESVGDAGISTDPNMNPLPEEALEVGTRLGDYKLLREIQRDSDFALYEAEQTSIGRRVALKTLYRKHRKDIRWVQGFVNEASARASVNHPAISLVYECDQEQGVNFYTLELVDAPSLFDLARQRVELDDALLWKVLSAASSALIYLRDNGMSHRLFTARSILIVKGSEPRIANPVRGRGLPLAPEEERQQMELLANAILPFLKKSGADPELFSLVDRMGTDRIDAINSLEALRKGLNPPDPKEGLTQAELAKITEKETNRSALIIGTAIGIAIVAVAIVSFLVMGSKPAVRDLETLIKIPAGKFPFRDGEEIELPEFWIGRYEVTIAEYAKFLDDIAAHPEKIAGIKHPDQPAEKTSYAPEKWPQYLNAAMKGKSFLGGPIDPNCPIVGVDFWDAYAYAAWRGARLPTEQEWEKAARGRSGSIYPWGDNLEPENFNSGIDHDGNGEVASGSVDGYKYWSPVDAIPADESRYGVVGLAGNVSEWTATWDAHPDYPDRRVPHKRGASFATTSRFELTVSRAADSASERNYYTGFRIASDKETLPELGQAIGTSESNLAEPMKAVAPASDSASSAVSEPSAPPAMDAPAAEGTAPPSMDAPVTSEPVTPPAGERIAPPAMHAPATSEPVTPPAGEGTTPPAMDTPFGNEPVTPPASNPEIPQGMDPAAPPVFQPAAPQPVDPVIPPTNAPETPPASN